MSHKMKIKYEIEYPLIKTDIIPQFRIMSELEVIIYKLELFSKKCIMIFWKV